MQMKTQGPVQGSMGIPPQIAEAAERARANNARNVRKPGEETQAAQPEKEAVAEAPVEASEAKMTDKDAANVDPIKILKDLGIEFSDELFQNLLFKGFVENKVEIVKGKFHAKFKTLTTDEYDSVDELLAEDVGKLQMTNDGFGSRRAMWILAFGVTELMGKPVCKPVLNKDKSVDKIETVKKRREVLGAMSPAVINPMIQKHGAMTVAINMITTNPEEHIKNS